MGKVRDVGVVDELMLLMRRLADADPDRFRAFVSLVRSENRPVEKKSPE